MKSPLEKIIEHLGGQTAFAKALTDHEKPDTPITQAHVWKWLNTTDDGIPAEHVIPACFVSDWLVKPHELRPDLYPHKNDGLPEHLRKKEAA